MPKIGIEEIKEEKLPLEEKKEEEVPIIRDRDATQEEIASGFSM